MTDGALAAFVGDPARFAEEHWGQRPLLRRAADDPAPSLDGVLGFGDVDRLVTEALVRVPSIRLVRDGTPLPTSSYTQTVRIGGERLDRTVRPDKVARAFEDGATIVLQALHRSWPPVAALCRDLELELTHPVQANAYVTPASSQGFAVHHDTHDVFVLQTHGRKRWRIFEPVVPLAGKEQPWSKAKRSVGRRGPGEPLLEADLHPGDRLYLPRGFPHDAVAQEGVSVHLTIGIHASTWLDLWRSVMERAAEHEPFRESLPVGFADRPSALADELPGRFDELVAWLGKSAGAEAAERFAASFWKARRSIVPGQLTQLRLAAEADDGSHFRRRHGAVFRVSPEPVVGDRVEVLLSGGTRLRMPRSAEAALRFVSTAEGPFAPGDLPGRLDRPSRLVLLRRLVREGAVEVTDDGR